MLYVIDGHFLSAEKQIHSSLPGYLAMTVLLYSMTLDFREWSIVFVSL